MQQNSDEVACFFMSAKVNAMGGLLSKSPGLDMSHLKKKWQFPLRMVVTRKRSFTRFESLLILTTVPGIMSFSKSM